MGRPDELMGGRTLGAGGEPGAGREGGAPRSGATAGADAATAGGAERAGAEGGRGAGAGAGRAAGAGAGRGDGVGIEISLAGRLVTSRWRSGVEMTGDCVLGVGLGVEGSDDTGVEVGSSVEADPAESGPVVAAALSSVPRPARVVAARAGFCSTGSSGETARRSPSLSALRRTRSAWASSIEDEWLFTPMPNAKQRSRASLFVRPSSRASS